MAGFPIVLTLPGWQGSGPAHWQSRWERAHGWQRVEQHDWQRPLRGDWAARLQDVVLAQPPTRPLLLAAHGLGCLLVAWWAAHSPLAGRVRGALLVAPPDMARADNRARIPGWAAPAAPQPLPFASVLVASSDDPCCSFESASQLARQWGSSFYHLRPHGHINVDSEVESPSTAPERGAKAAPIESQSTALAAAMASICNDERGHFGAQGGHGGVTPSLSGLGDWEEGLRLLDSLAPAHDIFNPTHENPP